MAGFGVDDDDDDDDAGGIVTHLWSIMLMMLPVLLLLTRPMPNRTAIGSRTFDSIGGAVCFPSSTTFPLLYLVWLYFVDSEIKTNHPAV